MPGSQIETFASDEDFRRIAAAVRRIEAQIQVYEQGALEHHQHPARVALFGATTAAGGTYDDAGPLYRVALEKWGYDPTDGSLEIEVEGTGRVVDARTVGDVGLPEGTRVVVLRAHSRRRGWQWWILPFPTESRYVVERVYDGGDGLYQERRAVFAFFRPAHEQQRIVPITSCASGSSSSDGSGSGSGGGGEEPPTGIEARGAPYSIEYPAGSARAVWRFPIALLAGPGDHTVGAEWYDPDLAEWVELDPFHHPQQWSTRWATGAGSGVSIWGLLFYPDNILGEGQGPSFQVRLIVKHSLAPTDYGDPQTISQWNGEDEGDCGAIDTTDPDRPGSC